MKPSSALAKSIMILDTYFASLQELCVGRCGTRKRLGPGQALSYEYDRLCRLRFQSYRQAYSNELPAPRQKNVRFRIRRERYAVTAHCLFQPQLHGLVYPQR